MSKEVKSYLFDTNSGKYYLKTERSPGFMEPYVRYQLVNRNDIPEEAAIKTVRSVPCYSYKDFLRDNQHEIDATPCAEVVDPDSELLGSE